MVTNCTNKSKPNDATFNSQQNQNNNNNNPVIDSKSLQLIAKKLNDDDRENKYGFDIKFLHQYVQSIEQLNLAITTGYEKIFNKFLSLQNQLEKDKHPVVTSFTQPTATTLILDVATKKRVKKTRTTAIKEEPKSPTLPAAVEQPQPNLNKSVKKKKPKKKNSTLGRISTTLDNKKTKVKTKSKKIKKSSILASIANIKQELQETHPQVIKQEPLLLYQEASTILNSTSRYNNINNNNNNKNVHASGKVKQMIELVEARLNASNSTVLTHDKTNCSVFANDNKQQSSRYQPNLSKVFPASSQKTCNRQLLFSQNKSTKPLNTPQVSNTLKSSTAVKSSKKTLRSSIDNRKQLTSTSRLDQKRQSIRKVNAFLNDLTTKINSNDKTSNLKSSKITTFKNHPLTSTQISSNVKTTIKEELSSEINIKSEPNDLIATTTTTITSISSIHSAVTRSVAKKRELIASNFNCQQNYRVAAATAALVNSTSKYTKTHERNTPLKSSKHVS
jgi:hypothetical protein